MALRHGFDRALWGFTRGVVKGCISGEGSTRAPWPQTFVGVGTSTDSVGVISLLFYLGSEVLGGLVSWFSFAFF